MRSRLVRPALIVAMLVVGAWLASASTISYDANIFLPSGFEAPTPWTQNVSLPRFNQAAFSTPGFTAVLDSVTVTLDWSMTGQIDVSNVDTVAHGFTNATSSIPLTLTGTGAVASLFASTTATAGPIDSATSTPSLTTAPPAYLGEPVPAGFFHSPGPFGSCPPFPPVFCTSPGLSEYSGIPASGFTSTSPLILAPYEGFGPANLIFTAAAGTGTYSGTGSDKLSFGGSATAGGYLEITYTYHEQQIPEPVTLFTVGSALIGIGLIFQRKLKRA